MANQLVKASPSTPNAHIPRALGLLNLASIQLEQRRYDDAASSAKEAAAEFRGLVGSPINRARNLLLLDMAHETWGEALRQSGRLAESEVQFTSVIRATSALLGELAKQSTHSGPPADALTPNVKFTRALAEVSLGFVVAADDRRRADAMAHFDRGISDLSPLAEQFPRLPKYRAVLTKAMSARADLRAALGQAPRAPEDRAEAQRSSDPR